MSKKIQISIPKPCHENWENMTPVEKGKFCGSCQKQVIDFSTMSDREVAMFFKKPSTSSTCGRFTTDQLDREIDIPRKRIPWVKYFFQFALPAFLISLKASAQNKSERNNVIVVDTKFFFNDTITLPEVVTVGFKQMGKVSPQISVQEVKKDSTFDSEYNKSYVFIGTMGGIMICRKSSNIIDTFFNKIFNKTSDDQSFKFYPNPVQSGSSLNIQWKRSETGYFIFQLIDLSGQTIFNKEIWVDDKASVLDVQLAQVSKGNYFIRMTNKQSGKSFSEKIIIQ